MTLRLRVRSRTGSSNECPHERGQIRRRHLDHHGREFGADPWVPSFGCAREKARRSCGCHRCTRRIARPLGDVAARVPRLASLSSAHVSMRCRSREPSVDDLIASHHMRTTIRPAGVGITPPIAQWINPNDDRWSLWSWVSVPLLTKLCATTRRSVCISAIVISDALAMCCTKQDLKAKLGEPTQ
jgi:hypothetical protein